MRNSDPKNLALNISLLLLLVLSIIYIGLAFFLFPFDIIVFLVLSACLFISSFLIIRFTVDRFIYEKIKIIYKTIHSLRFSRDEDLKKAIQDKSIESVNKEVQEWGEKQKREIMQLKQLADYRREFLGNISHELKTPIFNIQGYVLTLLDGGLDDPKINKKFLLRTEKSINRMIAIIEDLESIAQLESGELTLEFSRFNIVALAQEVLEFMELKSKKQGVVLKLDKNYDKPIFVTADKKRIRQVLINLLDNSVKYSEGDEGKTVVSFFDMDENILIEVTDNGIGIEKDNIPRIFERFYRTDKGRSREQGGSGLGLAIVKHIIEAHKQVINVRSSIGVGTTFGFTLKKV